MSIQSRVRKLESKAKQGECLVVFGRDKISDEQINIYKKAKRQGKKMLYVIRKTVFARQEANRVKSIIEC
jgi:hypothetical protein